ncbi:MAG: hypothetical protein AAF466_00090 [Bacteroidota bacterium]
MELLAKIVLLGVLAVLLWQDLKERQVWWFLLPLFAIAGSYLFFVNVSPVLYATSLLWNLAIVGVLLATLYAYARWKLKKEFLAETFGLADLLFFIAFALSMPTFAFLNFFVAALVFSLLSYLALRMVFRSKQQTVPLAGMMSLFLIAVYSAHWMGYFETLYLF